MIIKKDKVLHPFNAGKAIGNLGEYGLFNNDITKLKSMVTKSNFLSKAKKLNLVRGAEEEDWEFPFNDGEKNYGFFYPIRNFYRELNFVELYDIIGTSVFHKNKANKPYLVKMINADCNGNIFVVLTRKERDKDEEEDWFSKNNKVGITPGELFRNFIYTDETIIGKLESENENA